MFREGDIVWFFDNGEYMEAEIRYLSSMFAPTVTYMVRLLKNDERMYVHQDSMELLRGVIA